MTNRQRAAPQIALGCYIAYNVAATLASLGADRVSDSLGDVPVLAAGAAVIMLAYLGFAVGTVRVSGCVDAVALAGFSRPLKPRVRAHISQ